MRRILNVLIQFAIFWIAATYFGEYVVIAGTKEIVITTLLWVISGYAIIAVCLLCILPAVAGNFGKIIAMAAVLSVVLSIFTIGEAKKTD